MEKNMEPKIFIENGISCLVIQSCTLRDRHTHTQNRQKCVHIFALFYYVFHWTSANIFYPLIEVRAYDKDSLCSLTETQETKYCRMNIISYKRQKPSENEAKRIENRNQIEREKHKRELNDKQKTTQYNSDSDSDSYSPAFYTYIHIIYSKVIEQSWKINHYVK